MKVLIDTIAYVAFMKGEERITSILETAEDVLFPIVVLGELYGGFRLGKYYDKNTQELENFLSKPGIRCLDITKPMAERYGILLKQLREQGTPIPTNDIWVSAAVLESGAKLLTRDRHFENVPGLYIIPF